MFRLGPLIVTAALAGCAFAGRLFRSPANVALKARSTATPTASSSYQSGRGATTNLLDCPACKQQVSAQAESCPHCGHPIKHQHPVRREPLFLFLSGCSLVLSLLTPGLFLIFLIIGAVGCAVISIYRRESTGGVICIDCRCDHYRHAGGSGGS